MPEPIALKCPSCDAPLTAPQGRGQFYCQFCGTSVTVPREIHPVTPNETSHTQRAVGIPEKVKVEEFGSDLKISWSWFNWSAVFLVPFCIAWNAFLIGWYSMAMGDNGPPGGMKIIMLIFPLAHVAVGVGLAYACAVMLLNRTTIKITQGQMTIRNGPIPSPGNRTIPADDIEQLHVDHQKHKSNDGDTTHQYQLVAQLRSGREIKLLPFNTEKEVALAVEQLVEKHLGIVDV